MKILLATDGSDCARAAVDFLAGFPLPGGSTVTLLTVIDDRTIKRIMTGPIDDEQDAVLVQAGKALLEDTERLLAREGRRLQAAGRASSTAIRTGSPAHEIIKAAEELQADLIVVGSHGSSGLGDFLLGHVSNRLLEYAPCSVLIVKTVPAQAGLPGAAAGTAPPWRVLLAYDESEPSQQALALCAALPFDGDAEVTTLSVMPMVTAFRQDIRQRMNTIWQQRKHGLQAALDNAVTGLHWSTPHVTAQLREGPDVAKEILAAAEQAGSNLIMLGCKDEGAVRHFLLGSITRRIARQAHCSVWAVRSHNRPG